MRAALIGYGQMGQAVGALLEDAPDLAIAGIVDRGYLHSLAEVEAPDVAIDFSYPGDLMGLLGHATARGIPLVIGRTGLSEQDEAMIREAVKTIPIVKSSNFSIGVAVMRRIAGEAARALGEAFDIEIIEAHHKVKRDAPSGTARSLLTAVDPDGARPVVYGREGVTARQGGEIGVHALRGGTVCGEHTVQFYGDMEEMAISHRAHSRRIFALGALRAARYVVGRPAGLYSMEDVLFGQDR